jgi:hypothetical protein
MIKKQENSHSLPGKGPEDTAYGVARTVLAAIPYLGGAANEFLATVLGPPIDRRRAKWFEGLAERLIKLEVNVQGLTVENLRDNEAFISVVMHATHIAARTHQEEKLEALRNAIMNVALNIDVDAELQSIFLNYIDQLTVLHLTILDLLNDPNRWSQKHRAGLLIINRGSFGTVRATTGILKMAFRDFDQRENIYTQIIEDLKTRGLIRTNRADYNQHVGSHGDNLTELGYKFLKFIK